MELDNEEIDSCVDKITRAIKKKTREAGAKGAVVSVSGGLDSALVLCLAAKATDVVALMLPESKEDENLEDAVKIAEFCGVDYEMIELGDVLKAINGRFPWKNFPKDKRLPWGNVKARVRMVFSYMIANLDNRIVAGTGNRTELLLGYFTKYGDGASDFLPIGGMYKTEARQIAKKLGIPNEILEKKPSAGLWEGQTDEGELGLDYGNIDEVLGYLVDEKLSVRETARKVGVDIKKVKALSERIENNRHKRGMPEIVEVF